MLTSIFITYSIIQILVIVHIYRKSHHNLSYLLFFLLSATTWCWVFLNYLSVIYISSSDLIYIVRLIMLSAVVQTALFYWFAHEYPKKTWRRQNLRLINYGLFTLVAAIVAVSPYMFRSVKVVNGVIHMQVGPVILVFIGYISFSVISAFTVLTNKFRDSVSMKRAQLLFLLLAATVNWVIVPITNFALTLTVTKNLVFVIASPVYGLFFSSIIGYAIAEHHLFDGQKSLDDSVVYVDYHLRNSQHRSLQYYELQTLVYNASSDHVVLDFSGIKNLDSKDATLFNRLRSYMEKRGKKIYFIGYTKKVLKQLHQI